MSPINLYVANTFLNKACPAKRLLIKFKFVWNCGRALFYWVRYKSEIYYIKVDNSSDPTPGSMRFKFSLITKKNKVVASIHPNYTLALLGTDKMYLYQNWVSLLVCFLSNFELFFAFIIREIRAQHEEKIARNRSECL